MVYRDRILPGVFPVDIYCLASYPAFRQGPDNNSLDADLAGYDHFIYRSYMEAKD